MAGLTLSQVARHHESRRLLNEEQDTSKQSGAIRRKMEVQAWPPYDRQETSLPQKCLSHHPTVDLDSGTRIHRPRVARLCQRCSMLDFNAIFNHEATNFCGQPPQDLGRMTRKTATSGCPLCRLFYEFGITDGTEQIYHLRALSGLVILTANEANEDNHNFALGVLSGSPQTPIHPRRHLECRRRGLIVPKFDSLNTQRLASLY